MRRNDYLKLLVESIHSAAVATIGADGHPQTRVIDQQHCLHCGRCAETCPKQTIEKKG